MCTWSWVWSVAFNKYMDLYQFPNSGYNYVAYDKADGKIYNLYMAGN